MKNTGNLKKTGFVLFDLFLLPCFIYIYLSLPRLYAVLTYSDWNRLFGGSYTTLNLNLAYLIAAIYFIGKQFSPQGARILILMMVQLLFAIRILDVEMLREFQFSFSPAFFVNLEWDTFKILVIDYWLSLILVISFLVIPPVILLRLKPVSYGKKGRVILTTVFCLLLLRSGYILKKESWHSSTDFASQLFVEQAYDYYFQTDTLSDLTWTKGEAETVEALGISLKSVSLNREGMAALQRQDRNLFLIYLESFHSDFTQIGGSPYEGLAPNLDAFVKRSLFFPNFFNGVTPTINALISTQCGLLPRFDNRTLDKVVYAPTIQCVPDFLKKAGYYQMMLMGSPPKFSGIKKYAGFHQFDEVVGEDVIKKTYPEYKANATSWGINDYDVFEVAIDKLKYLKKRSPFHLTLFTLDTHPPFRASPECPVYKGNDKRLNAIHCTDHAFGRFFRHLENNGFLENSIILVTGDHMMHGTKKRFGRVFTAIYSPDLKPGMGQSAGIFGYSPDVAPTLMELMGTSINTMYAGKSLLSARKNQQHLISPFFELFQKDLRLVGKCPRERLLKTTLSGHDHSLSNCEHKKVISIFDAWILKN